LEYVRLPWRHSDQKIFVADIKKATNLLGWQPRISVSSGLDHMLEWLGAVN